VKDYRLKAMKKEIKSDEANPWKDCGSRSHRVFAYSVCFVFGQEVAELTQLEDFPPGAVRALKF
jgi:hypothetical protein